MDKLEALLQTTSPQNAVDVLCETQDAANLQIMAIAELARGALWREMEDVQIKLDSLLSAIVGIAAAANAKLDAAQIAISEARLGAAA